jgi:membrane-associated phospholipid phosphatase
MFGPDVPGWPRRRTTGLALAALGVVLFGLITADVDAMGPLSSRVLVVDGWVQDAADHGLATRGWGRALAALGDWWVVTPVIAVAATACLLLGSPRRALVLVAVAALGGALTWYLQRDYYAFFNTRVDFAGHLLPRGQSGLGYSHLYPSGHTIGGTLDLGLAILFVTEAWIKGMLIPAKRAAGLRAYALTVTILLALLAGVGRLLLRVHWYTDVLAAWAFSLAFIGVALALTTPKADEA